jgi:hypothetical protein
VHAAVYMLDLVPRGPDNQRVLARLMGCALALGLWGAADAYAVTVQQVAKFVGDCTQHCTGPRGVGEGKGGAFGAGVAVSADGRTAMIGAPEAKAGDGAVWVFVRNGHSWKQQGAKLVVDCTHDCGGPRGQGEDQKTFQFGQAIALSANGNTALIGAPGNGERGGAWVFTRSHGRWEQQGAEIIAYCHPKTRRCTGPNGTGLGGFGFGGSIALSANGSTGLIGASGGVGAAWVFARSHGDWRQQAELVGNCVPTSAKPCTGPNGTGENYQGVNTGEFGSAAALSADGNTALIGAVGDVSRGGHVDGAAWVFSRSGSDWSQQGPKLIGDCTMGCGGPNGTGEADSVGDDGFGESAALSGDGNTALLGAGADSNFAGAAWVFTRAAGAWTQQGAKLIGDCTSGCGGPNGTGENNGTDNGASFGSSVALAGNGSTALIGAPQDTDCNCGLDLGRGAAWLFTRSAGVWNQRGTKLIGDCTGSCTGPNGTGELSAGGQFGAAVSLSGTAGAALIGAPSDSCRGRCDGSLADPGQGAAWSFAFSGP